LSVISVGLIKMIRKGFFMKRKEYLMVLLIIITFLFTGCSSSPNLPTDSGERLIEVSIDRLEVYNLLSSVYNYRNSYFVIKVDSKNIDIQKIKDYF